MNFDFSEDQKLIQSQAKKFLRLECFNQRVREVMDDDSAYLDSELWHKVIQLGWPAMNIAESSGGLGLGYLEQCVLAMELGRSLAPIPLSSSIYLVAEALTLNGKKEQQQKYLPEIASGQISACLAVSEAPSSGAFCTPQCKVVAGRLSGEKVAVVDGQIADIALVSAVDESGNHNLYIIELNEVGVDRVALKSIDPSRPLSKLTFSEAPVSLLGSEVDCTAQILTNVFDRAAVLFAFEQVGGCEAALAMGLKYTQERYAFGRQVASFQAIKHKFADMYVAKEIALANAYYAAWALSSESTELPLAAATARVSAIDAYYLCSKENLQAHGGMGYTWELDCHLHYRRAQHLSLLIGGKTYWQERLAQQLLGPEE